MQKGGAYRARIDPTATRPKPSRRECARMERPEKAERPERKPEERKADPQLSPLGRGANPGASVETGPLTEPGSGAIAGQRGLGVAGEKGGPAGMETRENEDDAPLARRDPRDPA